MVSTLHLVRGKSATLSAVVEPYNVGNKTMTWSSSNSSVVKVNSYGKVTAGSKAAGKSATITVKSQDGSFTAKCKVYVVTKAVKIKSLTITPGKATGLLVGRTMQVKATVKPTKATGIVPTFASSNKAVATIDRAGVITALAKGKTTITVKAGSKSKSFSLTVGNAAPTKITLSKTTAKLAKGKKVTLSVASWAPSSTDIKVVSWKSSNNKIASVSSKGVVKGKLKGKATITVTTWNGKTAKCVVTVK